MEEKQWAIMEIFGHERYVGMISEHQIGGESFIRLDVPEIKSKKGFTKLFGKGAIYSITFTDEETAKILATELDQSPIELWKFLDWEKQRLLNPPENIDEIESEMHEIDGEIQF